MVGFFKDAGTETEREKVARKNRAKNYFFFSRKEGKIENAFCRRKAQCGVVCDKILMKSKLLY